MKYGFLFCTLFAVQSANAYTFQQSRSLLEIHELITETCKVEINGKAVAFANEIVDSDNDIIMRAFDPENANIVARLTLRYMEQPGQRPYFRFSNINFIEFSLLNLVTLNTTMWGDEWGWEIGNSRELAPIYAVSTRWVKYRSPWAEATLHCDTNLW